MDLLAKLFLLGIIYSYKRDICIGYIGSLSSFLNIIRGGFFFLLGLLEDQGIIISPLRALTTSLTIGFS